MFKQGYLNSIRLFLCGVIATCGIAEGRVDGNSNFSRYIVGHSKRLPDIPFGYDPEVVRFQKAPASMISVDLGTGNSWGARESKGKLRRKPLDLSSLPFWIYAKYEDAGAVGTCSYTLIDGLVPPLYKDLPEKGDILLVENEANAAVVRDCGRGLELVSREAYDSIFDDQFRSAYLRSPQMDQTPTSVVASELARDYAARLLSAFGGRVQLQKKVDEAGGRKAMNVIPRSLASALIAAGVRVPRWLVGR